MPFVRFLRTPSEAEAGPGHQFEKDGVYEVKPRSLMYWLGLRAVVTVDPPEIHGEAPIGLPAATPPLSPAGDEPSTLGLSELSPACPACIKNDDGYTCLGTDDPNCGSYAASDVTSTGERTIRHAGRGMYHVLQSDRQLTEKAIPKAEAEAMAAAPVLESGAEASTILGGENPVSNSETAPVLSTDSGISSAE